MSRMVTKYAVHNGHDGRVEVFIEDNDEAFAVLQQYSGDHLISTIKLLHGDLEPLAKALKLLAEFSIIEGQ